MWAILIQERCAKVIDGDSAFPDIMKDDEKLEVLEMAHSLLILNLVDNVLRQMDEEDTAYKI